MNDVQTKDEATIAAVVFMKANDKRELVVGGDTPKPYFYLNIVGAVEGDLCLVGSTGWNLVKVLRLVPIDHLGALAKTTQPLLCRVTEYDPAKILEAGHKLLEYQLRTSEARMQKEIDRALLDDVDLEIERVRSTHYRPRRRRAPMSNPMSPMSNEIDYSDELGDDLRYGKD